VSQDSNHNADADVAGESRLHLRRRLLWPNLRLERAQDIRPSFLAARGLKALLLDLDNTLIPHGSLLPCPEIEDWVAEMQAAGIALRLVSNATPNRLKHWAKRLDIPSIGLFGSGMAVKPFARAFRRALHDLRLPASQVAVVGDQVFTDMLGGNLIGAFTILVRPLSSSGMPHTSLVRRLEKLVLRGLASPKTTTTATTTAIIIATTTVTTTAPTIGGTD
jgi:uncharacterized protein